MDAETEVTMKVTLNMNEIEARWLKAQLQNSTDVESAEDSKMRQDFWNTLDSKGVKS